MIHGVQTKPVRFIPDERGRLAEILRSDDEIFDKFGQVYLTTVYPGVVKAWHYHKIQDDHFFALRGMAKVVLYDSREDSPTKGDINEFFIGEQNYMVLKIPHGVFHGFKGISTGETLILNCPTEMYNYDSPDEYRIHPHDNDIPYDWVRKDG